MLTDLNVAYIGTVYPHHAITDLQEIKDMGCTSINMCVNEADWFYYRLSRKKIRETARELGLKVYLNFHGFGSFAATFPGHYYQMNHPESVQISNLGNKGEYVCCPNNTEYVVWLRETLTELIEDLQPDGVFWDEPRFTPMKNFPEDWSCRCSYCQQQFQEQYSKEMPMKLTDEVIEFRQNSLLHFIDGLLKMAKAIRPEIENILCLMSMNRKGGGYFAEGWYGVVDWEPFIALPDVDVFSTDPYWIHNHSWEFFIDNVQEALELTRRYNKRCQIWVQAIWIEPGKEKFIAQSLFKAAEMGVDMLAVWAFRGESGSNYLSLGADAEECWQEVVTTYKELSNRIE